MNLSKITITKFHQSAFLVKVWESEVYAFDLGSECSFELIKSMGKVDAIFVSHKHPDHFNIENIKLLNAPFYAPEDVIVDLSSEYLTKSTIGVGDTIEVGSVSITAVESDHGPNISAPITNLGFIIKAADTSIFYLGDMAIPSYPMEKDFDVILIPVGGSKVFTPEQAMQYIRDINHKGVVIPVHYHGRADREAGQKFKVLADSICNVAILDVGESLEL